MEWTLVQPGAWMAIEDGDPEADGRPFVVCFRTEAAIDVPAHYHPGDEHLVVRNGPFALGFGDRFDCAGTEVQVAGTGPFRTFYV